MRRLPILVLVLLLLPAAAAGQLVRLCGDTARRALFFDLDKLWRYNLYEQSRWGAGLELSSRKAQAPLFDSRRYGLFGGYGYASRRWVWGASSSLHPKGLRPASALRLSVSHNYARSGNRQLSEAAWWDLGAATPFLARRMAERTSLLAGFSFDAGWGCATLEADAWRGWRTYDSHGSLYLAHHDAMPREDGCSASFSLSVGNAVARLQLGRLEPANRSFARLLAQLTRRDTMGLLATRLFLQGGIASAGTPYAFLFNLGGSYDTPIFLPDCLLTASPDEFSADRFALASLRVATKQPLYSCFSRLANIGSRPTPFFGATALWGDLRGEAWRVECGPLVPPDKGYAEFSAGFDALLCYGAVDYGMAAAWRLAPADAPYRRSVWRRNLSLLLTLQFRIDRWKALQHDLSRLLPPR